MLKKQAFKYWGFGLKILSQIEFPELFPLAFEYADVAITVGNIPVAPNITPSQTSIFKYILSGNGMFFWVDDIANYFVKSGTEIVIQPLPDLADARDLRLFTISFLIPAALWQRGRVPIHCSALLHSDGLVCIAGSSGAGKSSSIAGFVKRGYKVFSDDVVVINPSLTANASYPVVKLWGDAQKKLSSDVFSSRSFPMKKGMDKFGIFFHHDFDTGQHPVKKIFVLKRGDVDKITSKRLTGSEAFLKLRKNVYRQMLLHTGGLKVLAFHTVSALANSCTVYEITRPAICDIDELVTVMEKLLMLDND